jgi:hypothetical protein
VKTAAAVVLGLVLTAGLVVHSVRAQPAGMPPGAMPHHGMHHGMHHAPAAAGTPAMPGQDAFGAIAEVVRLLDADPATDWAKVDLERLRQHLIDMQEVVLRSQVSQAPVPGGLVMTVTGSDRTERAIRAMVPPHAGELDRMAAYAARAEIVPGGVRLTVVSKTPDDARAVARLRGLGFAGLLAEGDHHGPHHLAMARGERMPGHRH